MDTINEITMNCKKDVKINFNGGDLSSDSGLLLYKAFMETLNVEEIIKNTLSFDDDVEHHTHENTEVLLQKIYQQIAGYQSEIADNELQEDPVLQEIMEKEVLASQPTISRSNQAMTKETMIDFQETNLKVLDSVYNYEEPNLFIYDLDSTHAQTYGEQYGTAYNHHYNKSGFHPLVMFNGYTGDFLKGLLRSGNVYTSRCANKFVESVFIRHKKNYPDIKKYLRADSGFAIPELYKCCERNNIPYVIRLKENNVLKRKAQFLKNKLDKKVAKSKQETKKVYGEITYQAGSWDKERRVVIKIEKTPEKLFPDYTFIVTTMEANSKAAVNFYNKRGTMENFIKESKYGFALDKLSSTDYWTNANRLQQTILAYNIHNSMRRLCFPKQYQKNRIQTTRLKLIKIAGRKISTGRYTYFKLSSHAVYKKLFFKIHENISKLPKSKAG